MASESHPVSQKSAWELRGSGSVPDYAPWIETIAGRWQHVARCAVCHGLKPVGIGGHRREAIAGESP